MKSPYVLSRQLTEAAKKRPGDEKPARKVTGPTAVPTKLSAADKQRLASIVDEITTRAEDLMSEVYDLDIWDQYEDLVSEQASNLLAKHGVKPDAEGYDRQADNAYDLVADSPRMQRATAQVRRLIWTHIVQLLCKEYKIRLS